VIPRAAGAAGLVLAAAACGHAMFLPPTGPGAATDASSAWAEATSGCRAAQSYVGTLRISGRAGSQRIWRLAGLSIDTAVTRNQIYMGATVSGTSAFLLAGSASEATLWLRGDHRRVKAPAGEILEAILGLSMPPDRLLAILAGCGSRVLDVTSASRYDGLIAVQTPDARVFLERHSTSWRTLGAEAEGFRVQFSWKGADVPATLWIKSTPGREPSARLDISVRDASVTDPVPSSVFNVPSGAASAEPMTIEELRSGSWRGK
jgi:hypothetical protein